MVIRKLYDSYNLYSKLLKKRLKKLKGILKATPLKPFDSQYNWINTSLILISY